MSAKTTVTTTSRTEIAIDHRDIQNLECVRHAIQQHGAKGMRVTGIDVHYRVPGGGDWSSMDAPVDSQHPISVVIEAQGQSE